MPMTVEWNGLDEMVRMLAVTLVQRVENRLAELTEDVFEQGLQTYLDNLSGSSPSTADHPLPVGIDTGDLIEHAANDSHVIDAYSCEWRNESDHAAYIEFGTEKMEPRMPLQDMVNRLNLGIEVMCEGAMEDILDV